MSEPNSQAKVLTLTIKGKDVLYAAYMSFLSQGGLFIPTNREREFALNQAVTLALHLMDEPETLMVPGTIVWKTPKGAQGNRAPGIGVQFEGDLGKQARNKIETYLAGALQSEKPTHTC